MRLISDQYLLSSHTNLTIKQSQYTETPTNHTQVAQETCEKGEKVTLTDELSMVCRKAGWTPKQKQDRAKPGAPPCEDSIGEDQCQADRGHCLQYTDKGQEMDRTCPGTCGSTCCLSL